MSHTHKHEKRIWLPDAHLVQAIADSTEGLRTSDQEFERAFKILKKYPQRITVFGSTQPRPHDDYYKQARDVCGRLSHEGYAIVTGGGPGIMEAANRGAYEAGGPSIGFNIVLPKEQFLNKYTTDNLAFHYFFTRKVMMTFYVHGFVYFPGGFGTFDEFFEVITLIQTKKMPRVPVVLFGKEYWGKLDLFLERHMLEDGYIKARDERLFQITDDIDELCEIMNSDYDS